MKFQFSIPFLAFGLALAGISSTATLAGPFPPAAPTPGHDGIAADDPAIIQWASAAEVVRGLVEAGAVGDAITGFGEPISATGAADATSIEPYSVVSLGDGGSATLTFDKPFSDGPGTDIVVFENSFGGGFIELAHVEVSSNGIDFFRFPSHSFTQIDVQAGSFLGIDPTEISGLAGKHPVGFGTGFDLAELRGSSKLLDLERVTHVRVVDVVGSLDPAYGSTDSTGRLINDPFPTPFFAGGFDLDAVGITHPMATDYATWSSDRGLAEADPFASDVRSVPHRLSYLSGDGKITISATPTATHLNFTAYPERADIPLRLEASADLKDWSVLLTVTGEVLEVTPAGPGVAATRPAASVISLQIPNDTKQWRFFRLTCD